MDELNNKQKFAVIGLFLCSFTLCLIGISYYYSVESACGCEDCSVKRFFLLEKVEGFTPDQENYDLYELELNKYNNSFITWYDQEYAPKCEEVSD